MILEVCAFNIHSCLVAERAGAARIEFCADPIQGGTTPSYGAIKYALEHISIPVFPMVRPRGGDFIYDKHDLAIIKNDVLFCRDSGCKGIAAGIQLPDRRIDTENLKRITEWAYPMEVTCHKVFDAVPDALTALEDVIATGCTRILTSGLGKTAIDGAAVIKKLIEHSAGRIIIMPGGSVRSANIERLVSETGAQEYHSSCMVAIEKYTADYDEANKLFLALDK